MTVFNARPTPQNVLSTDADWEALINGAGLGDGVIMNPSTSLNPSLDTGGRNAVIAAGSCIVKGKLWNCDASVSTAIPAASGQDRIDRLVMRLNRAASTAATWIQPVVVTGTPSGTPVIPALTQTTSGNWDLPISHWTSKSTGSLINLVDDRFDTGKVMQSGLAANKPTWLVRPSLYFETDNNDIQIWNGSVWQFVAHVPDVSGQNMPAMINSWSISDFAKYRKTSGGDLQVAFKNLHVSGANSADGTLIWAAGAIFAAYRPPVFHRVPCVVDVQRDDGTGRAEGAALEFGSDGSVGCFGISSTANRVDCYATIPLWA